MEGLSQNTFGNENLHWLHTEPSMIRDSRQVQDFVLGVSQQRKEQLNSENLYKKRIDTQPITDQGAILLHWLLQMQQ